MRSVFICNLLFSLIVMFLFSGQRSDAMIIDYYELDLSDGSVISFGSEERAWSSDVTIISDGVYYSLSYYGTSSSPFFEVHIQTVPTEDALEIMAHGINTGEDNTPFDSSILPPDYRELWHRCEFLCEELLDNDNFWNSLEIKNDKTLDTLRTSMERFKDGYYSPDVSERVFGISLNVGNGVFSRNVIGTGFTVEGPGRVRFDSLSPYGAENPELYVYYLPNSKTVWIMHLDPETQTNNIDIQVITEDRYSDDDVHQMVSDVIDYLNATLDIVPRMEEIGLIEFSSDEYTNLAQKAIYALSEYEQDIEIDYSIIDTLMMRPEEGAD